MPCDVSFHFHGIHSEPSPESRQQGTFTFVRGGGLHVLTLNLTKIPLVYSASYFNLGVLELCLGGLSPPKPPGGDGTASATSLSKECLSFMLANLTTVWLNFWLSEERSLFFESLAFSELTAEILRSSR